MTDWEPSLHCTTSALNSDAASAMAANRGPRPRSRAATGRGQAPGRGGLGRGGGMAAGRGLPRGQIVGRPLQARAGAPPGREFGGDAQERRAPSEGGAGGRWGGGGSAAGGASEAE